MRKLPRPSSKFSVLSRQPLSNSLTSFVRFTRRQPITDTLEKLRTRIVQPRKKQTKWPRLRKQSGNLPTRDYYGKDSSSARALGQGRSHQNHRERRRQIGQRKRWQWQTRLQGQRP